MPCAARAAVPARRVTGAPPLPDSPRLGSPWPDRPCDGGGAGRSAGKRPGAARGAAGRRRGRRYGGAAGLRQSRLSGAGRPAARGAARRPADDRGPPRAGLSRLLWPGRPGGAGGGDRADRPFPPAAAPVPHHAGAMAAGAGHVSAVRGADQHRLGHDGDPRGRGDGAGPEPDAGRPVAEPGDRGGALWRRRAAAAGRTGPMRR